MADQFYIRIGDRDCYERCTEQWAAKYGITTLPKAPGMKKNTQNTVSLAFIFNP